MDSKEAVSLCDQRQGVYRLLVDVYRKELAMDALREIYSPEFLATLKDLGFSLEDSPKEPDESFVEELSVEYTRLFLGPGPHIPPYESVHRGGEGGGGDGKLWGDSTVALKRFVEASGLTFTPEHDSIPDHVSTELEFMCRVIEEERSAWEKEDLEAAMGFLAIEQKFLQDHLLQWAPLFCEKIIESAELPFYREMAKLTKAVLELDYQTIQSASQDNRDAGPFCELSSR